MFLWVGFFRVFLGWSWGVWLVFWVCFSNKCLCWCFFWFRGWWCFWWYLVFCWWCVWVRIFVWFWCLCSCCRCCRVSWRKRSVVWVFLVCCCVWGRWIFWSIVFCVCCCFYLCWVVVFVVGFCCVGCWVLLIWWCGCGCFYVELGGWWWCLCCVFWIFLVWVFWFFLVCRVCCLFVFVCSFYVVG